MKKLKILFDYSPAYKPMQTGIPILASSLYAALEKNDEIYIEKTLDIAKYIPRKPHKLFRFFEQFLYHNLYLPFKLHFGKYDAYIESQYMFIPLFKPKNTMIVTFLYDIALALYDDLHTEKHTKNWRAKLPLSIQNSDLLITLSHSSKKDIEQYLSTIYEQNKSVEYIYIDAKLTTFTSKNTENILARYNIEDTYLLYLGTLEPRKNPLKILEGFHLYKQKTKSTMKLVYAGKKGWLYDDVMAYISKHRLENEVIFTGYISEEEKVVLLQHCKVFLFLSLYEGFGIPALEALRLGVPTLLSDIPVFHELFADNAQYTQHNNAEEIAQSIEKILISPPLIEKESFDKFSWEKSAYMFISHIKTHYKSNI